MKNLLLCACLLLCHFIFAQSRSERDTLFYTDGTFNTGTFIQKDIRTNQVRFMTDDSVMHTVAWANIAQVKTARPIAGLVPAKPIATTKDTTAPGKAWTSATYEDHIDWNDPSISRKALLKHRTGVGLAITSSTLAAGGLIMLIAGLATNGETRTTSTSATVNIGAIGGIGLLSLIAGVPMMISGIVKINRSARMARSDRARRH